MRFTMGCKRSEKRAKLLTLSHDLNNIRVGYVGSVMRITLLSSIFFGSTASRLRRQKPNCYRQQNGVIIIILTSQGKSYHQGQCCLLMLKYHQRWELAVIDLCTISTHSQKDSSVLTPFGQPEKRAKKIEWKLNKKHVGTPICCFSLKQAS